MIRLWDVQTGAFERTLEGSQDTINSLTYSPCGLQIASGGDDQRVRVWDAMSGECLVVVAGFDESILSVDWQTTLGDSYLITGGMDKLVRQWQVIDQDDGIKLRLCWISPHGKLKTKDCILEEAQDLGKINTALLRQGGAVGEPAATLSLDQASRQMVALTNAAAKFKQLVQQNQK